MPKKFGNNTRSAEARAIKNEKKQQEEIQRQKEIDDAYWEDDDKHINKKSQRKENKEQKRLNELEHKKELQKIHDEEMSQLKTKPGVGTGATKLTQADIRATRERQEEEKRVEEARQRKAEENAPIEENPNRRVVDGDEARSVEEAIAALSCGDTGPAERHPERRFKASYTAFEEKLLPELRAENPGMRLQQLKQLAFKQFQTSPENPKNQEHVAYNSK